MSRHMKRLTAPRSWIVEKKGFTWATKPRAGPHPIERSLPLVMVIRDYLGYSDTGREAKRIIGGASVMVDGRPTRDHKRAVGLMDIVSMNEGRENYRMLFDKRGKLRLVRIDKEQSAWKLVRLEGKTTLRKGLIQLNLHDGRNIILDEDDYKVGDVLKISVPSQDILGSFKMNKGSLAMIIGGRHRGEIATISSYEKSQTGKDNIVEFKEGFSTTVKNVFVIGKKTPEIVLPEVKVA